MTGWLSVDPMADKYPGLSPYAYCAWNPVRLVDPDGEEIWLPEITENGDISYVAEKGDTKETFTQQYNVSKEEQMRYLKMQVLIKFQRELEYQAILLQNQ